MIIIKNKILNKKSYKNKKNGFALLYAVFVSSLLLSIALSVSNIALKEIVFSISGKEANDAFYAADIGAECVLYYDTSDMDNPFIGGSTPIICNDETVTLVDSSHDTVLHYDFVLSKLGTALKSCAEVTVLKDESNTETKITSIGYNNGGENSSECIHTDNSVQRAIELNY